MKKFKPILRPIPQDQRLSRILDEAKVCNLIRDAVKQASDLSAVRTASDNADRWPNVRSIKDFEEDGTLTMDQGFTIRFAAGAEFQVSIVQSK